MPSPALGFHQNLISAYVFATFLLCATVCSCQNFQSLTVSRRHSSKVRSLSGRCPPTSFMSVGCLFHPWLLDPLIYQGLGIWTWLHVCEVFGLIWNFSLIWPLDVCVCVCVCTCTLSHFCRVQLFVTPWTVAHQALLSMWFPRQEYWSG